MRILVNGEDRHVVASTLEAALGELGYGSLKVATAVDGDFVPATRRATCALGEGSALEILAPMQGG